MTLPYLPFADISYREMLGDVSSASGVRGGRTSHLHLLAEERKEQLKQLPPPTDILDPSFAPRCILSSRSRSRNKVKFYAF